MIGPVFAYRYDTLTLFAVPADDLMNGGGTLMEAPSTNNKELYIVRSFHRLMLVLNFRLCLYLLYHGC